MYMYVLHIKDFFSNCEQICSYLRIWLDLLKKSFMENFICCAYIYIHIYIYIYIYKFCMSSTNVKIYL